MSNEILQAKKWNKTQQELLNFLDQTEPVAGSIIRKWIADSIVHFTDLNVPESIISHFLSKMEHISITGKKIPEPGLYFTSDMIGSRHDEEEEKESAIGPFVFVGNGYKITDNNRLSMKIGGRVRMTPVLVAFNVAQNIIDKYENEARIIPKTIIEELDKHKESTGIAVSLRLIQSSFENKDTQTMVTALVSATDLLLALIPELSKKKIGDKLNKIYSDKVLHNKYSINPEIIWSINNARIIRNIDIHVSRRGNEMTLYEAVSYAHLLNLLIFSVLSSGELNLTTI
jgi:hypothetical protein